MHWGGGVVGTWIHLGNEAGFKRGDEISRLVVRLRGKRSRIGKFASRMGDIGENGSGLGGKVTCGWKRPRSENLQTPE